MQNRSLNVLDDRKGSFLLSYFCPMFRGGELLQVTGPPNRKVFSLIKRLISRLVWLISYGPKDFAGGLSFLREPIEAYEGFVGCIREVLAEEANNLSC